MVLHHLLEWDRWLFLKLNGLHHMAFDDLMWYASATWPWFPLFGLLVWALWKNYGWRGWLPLVAVALVLTLSDQGASGLLKPTVRRLRPCNEPDLAALVHTLRGYCSSSFSFASSHASNSVALAAFCTGVFRRYRPRWLLVAVWCWAVLHSYSRIYLGVHYPLDLLGGAVVGLLAAGVGLALLRWLQKRPGLALRVGGGALLLLPVPLQAQDNDLFTGRWDDYLGQLFDGELWLEIALAALATAILYLLVRLSRRGRVLLERWVSRRLIDRLPELRIQNFTLVDRNIWLQVSGLLLRGARVVLLLLALYIYLPVVFSLFPATRSLAVRLIDYVLEPLTYVFYSIIEYLPKLFFVLVIAAVTRFVLRLLAHFFRAISEGKIVIQGFYADWAKPTFNLVRLLVVAFALVVVFPYLPGSSSPAFQGVSIFLGVLLSLGSSSAISNVIAGLVLTYMRPFQLGDYIRVNELEGEVVEKTLFVTRLRTIKNVEISITNSQIIGQPIINYSTMARQGGIALHTSVTIGYDAPWATVEALLIEAARRSPRILSSPEPFVLQTALQDFYINYELNAWTDDPHHMAIAYSELHRHIQDCFNEAGVEIMSPHYAALRDGNATSIPEPYRPAEYQAPQFRHHLDTDGRNIGGK
jgi:small-conductance mechanosensitive channel/membrane-associated phospholipid phosphatase